MSFEFFRKCIFGQWWSPQVNGEAVSSGRASHGKVPPTNRGPCTRHNECPAVCRPQLPPADDRRHRVAHICQVWRRQTKINPCQAGWYSIYPFWRDRMLYQPWWLVVYLDGLPFYRHSLIQVITTWYTDFTKI